MNALQIEAGLLKESGALGRSSQLIDLFDFLVASSEEVRSPKESEIAHHVYGKPANFDASQDALVRVHIHRLRGKLDQYYAAHPSPKKTRLCIPKGEYRLALQAEDADKGTAPARADYWKPVALMLLAMLLFGAGWIAFRPESVRLTAVQTSPFWRDFLGGEKTTLVIVGDHYLYGEHGGRPGEERLVRDAAINSPEELDERRMLDPKIARQYFNTDTYQIPLGVAAALRHVVPVIVGPDPQRQRVRLLPMSQVTPDMLRAANIIYIGHLAGLDMLAEPVFGGSRFRLESQFTSLADKETGRTYTAAPSASPSPLKRLDIAYISSFPGSSDNRIIILAGAGDAGLMQAAEIATSSAKLESLLAAAKGNRDMEAVFEVTSVRNMNMGSRMAVASPLDTDAIWRSTSLDPPRTRR